MAVQIETQGQIQEFLEVLRRRAWQVILPALLIVTVGSAFAVIVPKKYVVRTQVELRDTRVGKSTEGMPDVATAALQITAMTRIKKVVEELEWPEYLVLSRPMQNEFLQKIKENISVLVHNKNRTAGSTFVSIEYMDPDPNRAEKFLKALRTAWIDDVVERGRKTMEATLNTQNADRNRLEKQYHDELDGLAKMRRNHGLSPSKQTALDEKDHPVFMRLNENQGELESTQLELAQSRSEEEGLQTRIDLEDDLVKRQTRTKGQAFDDDLARIEQEINDHRSRRKRFKPDHSKYKLLTIDIEELVKKRAQLRRLEISGSIATQFVINEKKEELKEELADLVAKIRAHESKEKILEENIRRDEERVRDLAEAYRDVEAQQTIVASLNKAYQQASSQYFETKRNYEVISGPQGNPFDITEDVVPPRRPQEPNPLLIVIVSILAGLGVGIGSAATAEYSRNCYRGVSDISRVMVVPVLGAVNTIKTQAQMRRRALRRMMVGFTSLATIGAIVLVTWAWSEKPDLLSRQVRDAIDNLREQFR